MLTKSHKSLFPFLLFAVVILFNLIFSFLPLLNILSYESSAINGILLAFISGIYWLKYFRTNSFKNHLIFYFLISIIPFIILLISTLICQKCPISDGLKFYAILSLPSIIVGIAIAQFSNFISSKFMYLTFILIYILVLLGFLPELYSNPQIYFFNPIFGYFPGVIYDQNIQITSALVKYRLINVAFSIIVLLIFYKNYHFKIIMKLIVIIGVTLAYLNISELKSDFNFSTNISTIKKELNSEIKTEHFDIIFSDSLSERERKLLVINHEFYYSEISNLLNIQIDKSIVSIIFDTGAQKKRLFGAENADVTKPWLNHIYTDFSNYQRTLKHELAHIFSAKFAKGYFNLPSNYNPGLIEGFAMAVENNFADFNIHYFAALAYQNNYRISLEKLFGNFSFFANASSLSYIYAGSFIKFLAENYGWEKITELYKSTDFEQTFGHPISTLEESYFNSLDKLDIEKNKNSANYYFGRKPLIKKFCARATAKQLIKTWELYEQKEYKKSAENFISIYQYSNSFSALFGYVKSEEKLGSIKKAVKILEKEKSNFFGSAYYYSTEYLLGNLYLKNNNDSLAFVYADSLIFQEPSLSLKRNAVMLKSLFKWNKELGVKYLNFPQTKINVLEKYLEQRFSNKILQNLILLYTENKVDYESALTKIEKISFTQNLNSDTYFILAKFAFEKLVFSTSIKFYDSSVKNANNYRIDTINELKKKAVWSLKNKLN